MFKDNNKGKLSEDFSTQSAALRQTTTTEQQRSGPLGGARRGQPGRSVLARPALTCSEDCPTWIPAAPSISYMSGCPTRNSSTNSARKMRETDTEPPQRNRTVTWFPRGPNHMDGGPRQAQTVTAQQSALFPPAPAVGSCPGGGNLKKSDECSSLTAPHPHPHPHPSPVSPGNVSMFHCSQHHKDV